MMRRRYRTRATGRGCVEDTASLKFQSRQSGISLVETFSEATQYDDLHGACYLLGRAPHNDLQGKRHSHNERKSTAFNSSLIDYPS